MFLQDVDRQVVAGHVAHERLCDQVKGGDMGAETLTQFQGGVQAGRRRRGLVDVNQKILDRHRLLHRGKGRAGYSLKASSRLERTDGRTTTSSNAAATTSRPRLSGWVTKTSGLPRLSSMARR